jgi:hypothetical protein
MIISLGNRLLDPSSSLPGSRWRAEPTRWTQPGGHAAEPVHAPCLTLLPVGFTEPSRSPGLLVSSYLTVSPLPCSNLVGDRPPRGGLLSVALSLALRPVGVTHHCVLRSPDFPPAGQYSGLCNPFHARPAIIRPTSNYPYYRRETLTIKVLPTKLEGDSGSRARDCGDGGHLPEQPR